MTRLTNDMLPDAHVLLGSIGDAYSDRAPLQVGQFEAGNEVDDVLSKIYLEGRGGGTKQESYELGMYYMARHTELDSVKKRNKKGFLFMIGDELPYSKVDPEVVKDVIGDILPAPIPTSDILQELRQKFEVFWIFPNQTQNYSNPTIRAGLEKYFGDSLINLEAPELITPTILCAIAMLENKPAKKVLDTLTEAQKQQITDSLEKLKKRSKLVPVDFL
jgi:hypothetical protein